MHRKVYFCIRRKYPHHLTMLSIVEPYLVSPSIEQEFKDRQIIPENLFRPLLNRWVIQGHQLGRLWGANDAGTKRTTHGSKMCTSLISRTTWSGWDWPMAHIIFVWRVNTVYTAWTFFNIVIIVAAIASLVHTNTLLMKNAHFSRMANSAHGSLQCAVLGCCQCLVSIHVQMSDVNGPLFKYRLHSRVASRTIKMWAMLNKIWTCCFVTSLDF